MDPFLGEVRIFPWSWAPEGWALCDGTQLAAQQNAALNALLGQTFGGNGSTMFKLPDLRGRTPVGTGLGSDGLYYQPGQVGGAETVTLTVSNLPQHIHSVTALGGTSGNASNAASGLPAKVGTSPAGGPTVNIYSVAAAAPPVQLAGDTFAPSGTSAPHNNMQPYLVLNFCIATAGIFPPRQ